MSRSKERYKFEYGPEPVSNAVMEEFPETAAGATRLEVDIIRGNIKVRAGEGERWGLIWTANGDNAPQVEREGDTVQVSDMNEECKRLDLIITMPNTVDQVELNSGSGGIQAEALRGQIELSSGNGSIMLHSSQGHAEISSGNGEISIVEYEGRLAVETGNGKVHLKHVAGKAEIESGNGEIEIIEPRALGLEAESGHGGILINDGSITSSELTAGMGTIRCSTLFEPGNYEMQNEMGSITVYLPASVKARIDAQTSFGQIRSDFPLVRVGRSGPMSFSGARMVGSTAEGEANVELTLRSSKGQITLRQGGAREEVSNRRSFNDPLPPHLPIPATPAVAPVPPIPPIGPLPATPVQPPQPEQATVAEDEMMAILNAVARGEISPDEADRLLSGRS